MKHLILPIIAASILFTACSKSQTAESTQINKAAAKAFLARLLPPPIISDNYSKFISIDSANKMLLSYLNSIHYDSNDSDLHSIIFHAKDLRTLLADSSITNVKIMFAHTPAYINAGGQNINCGYQAGELTVIIAGYDSSGNYKHNPANTVLETGAPCPTNCPVAGTASSNLLQ